MRYILLFTLCLFLAGFSVWEDFLAATALSVGSSTSPETNAVLEVTSTTKGFFPPRMTTAQKNAISVTADDQGLTVYDTDTDTLNVYNGTAWQESSVSSSTLFYVEAEIIDESGASTPDITLSTGNVAAWTLITGSSHRIVNRGGDSSIKITCNGAAPTDSATGCGGGTEDIGFAVTVPSAGIYRFCLGINAFYNPGTFIEVVYRLSRTDVNSGALANIQDANTELVHTQTSNSGSEAPYQQVCGTFTLSTAKEYAFRLYYQQNNSGSTSHILLFNDANWPSSINMNIWGYKLGDY